MSALRRIGLIGVVSVMATGVFWLARPASAIAETADKLLPPESVIVLHFDLQQLQKSQLFKKYVAKELKKALRDNADLQKFEEETGINILADIHSVSLVFTKLPKKIDPNNPAGVDPKEFEMLIVVRGEFAKDSVVRAMKKSGEFTSRKYQGYEIFVTKAEDEDDEPAYICVADDGLILVSNNRIRLQKSLDAMGEGSRPKGISRELKTVIEAIPQGQSLWFAMSNPQFLKDLAQNDPNAADLVDKFAGLSLSVGVEDKVKIGLRAHATDADAARELRAGLEKLRGFLALWAANDQQVGPLLQDVLNTMKTAQKGSMASLEFEVTEEVIKRLVSLVQGLFGGGNIPFPGRTD